MLEIESVKWNKLNFKHKRRSINEFVYLTGNNGSGKSASLVEIAASLLGLPSEMDNFSINFSGRPEKIITYSMAPFNKFESRRMINMYKDERIERIGVSFSSGRYSLLFQAVTEFVKSSQSKLKLFDEIASVVGLFPKFKIIFSIAKSRISDRQLEKDFFGDDLKLVKEILNHRGRFSLLMEPNHVLLEKFENSSNSSSKLKDFTHLFYEQTILNLLLKVRSLGGLIVREIEIDTPKGWQKLDDFSSGQMSFFIGLVILASSIKNNTVVLIDEPEVSLHPDWQSKFCDIIYMIARHHKNCYFFIATHSPILIASVNERENTQIYNLGDEDSHLERLVDDPKSIEDIFATYFDVYTPNSFLIKTTVIKAVEAYEKRDADSFAFYKDALMRISNEVKDKDTSLMIREISKRSIE